MKSLLSKIVLVIVVLGLFNGCAHYAVNNQSRTINSKLAYRFDNLARGSLNTDSIFVCLLFSGGGTRAAALSYGIMQALRDIKIRVDGQNKRLLDEVDCISSVSGGSFTAAYYGLFRDKLFQDFNPLFLNKNIQWELASQLFNPVNWIRLASPYFGRIDLAAELYHRDIFKSANFEQLRNNGRPFVILNATNVGSDRRFEFTQEYFDALGSQLDNYPVSRAVAASSAFPYLLSPVSLKNYPLVNNYKEPAWYKNALIPKNWITDRYNSAKNFSVFLNKKNRYIHLMDGGLSDNIGARAFLDAYDRGFIRTLMNDGAIKQLVVIVVNSRTQSEDQISRKETPPGLFAVAEKTATVAMDNYSHDSVAKLREALYERVQTQKNDRACNDLLAQYCPKAPDLFPLADLDPYVIEINFEAISQLPDEDPQYYLNLPTSFDLNKEQVNKLIAIGPKLLTSSTQFQCLLKVLNAETSLLTKSAQCLPGSGIFP